MGGSVVYSPVTNSLYYSDIFNGSFYRYSFDEDKVYKIFLGEDTKTDFINPVQDRPDLFYLGLGTQVLLISWDGSAPTFDILDTLVDAPDGTFVTGMAVAPNDDIFFGTTKHTFCDGDADLSLLKYSPKTKEIVAVASGFVATYGLLVYPERNIVVQLDPCTGTAYEYGLGGPNGTFSEFIRRFFVISNIFHGSPRVCRYSQKVRVFCTSGI